MNIIEQSPSVTAQELKSRLSRDRAALIVYADECGDVILNRAHDPRRRVPPPDEFLVGVYRVTADVELIEGDIEARRDEILAASTRLRAN